MNSKRAKELRKIAKLQTPGAPERNYVTSLEDPLNSKDVVQLGMCTRKYEKLLKQTYKQQYPNGMK